MSSISGKNGALGCPLVNLETRERRRVTVMSTDHSEITTSAVDNFCMTGQSVWLIRVKVFVEWMNSWGQLHQSELRNGLGDYEAELTSTELNVRWGLSLRIKNLRVSSGEKAIWGISFTIRIHRSSTNSNRQDSCERIGVIMIPSSSGLSPEIIEYPKSVTLSMNDWLNLIWLILFIWFEEVS